MAYINRINLKLIFLYLFITHNKLEAKIILPELLTKQTISNIRFIGQDAKFTLYQKNSGNLYYSSNYKIIELLKGKFGTQYTVTGTKFRKKLVITQNENFHTFYSGRLLNKIYLTNFGDTKLREIGKGIGPRLHFNDMWLSYYHPDNRTITFENTLNSGLALSIKLTNKLNPYFIPQVLMTDINNIFYTDIGENGEQGLIQYKRSTSKAELVFKTKNPTEKIEIAQCHGLFLLGVFGINNSKNGSQIYKVSFDQNQSLYDFNKKEEIYHSPTNDFGNLQCYGTNESENLYFIKNFGSNDFPQTEIVEHGLATKNITPLTEQGSITNIINLDGTLITLDKGKYLIVKGQFDFKSIDSLKTLPPESFIPSQKNDETSEDLKTDSKDDLP